ncbi:hypothetical protein [Spiroplasma sp. DGKH1]|uniref:hypothetical protein n=1 Tax=Spiroplasma sp. DGKH1 TaxID=3050074 RepID=UPI0034C662BA
MRLITRNLVTLVFIVLAYFAYSSWVNWLTDNQGNSNLVQILSPFKLIILGMLFAMIIPTFKSIFMSTIIGMRQYKKTKSDFLLYNYDKLHTILENMKINILKNNMSGIKKDLLLYEKSPVKPEFVNTLVRDLRKTALIEGDFTRYKEVIDKVLGALTEIYQKERQVILTANKKEAFFDFKRGYEMASQGSKYNVDYYQTLYNNVKNRVALGWKIFSLSMFRFYFYLLGYGLGITTILAIVVFPILNTYSNVNLEKWGAIIFVICCVTIALIVHLIKTLQNKNLNNKNYLIIPALVYYSLIALIVLNICLTISIMPSITDPVPNVGESILAVGPLPYLLSLAYLVLSTALLLYVIATLMDSFKADGLSLELIIEGLVVPFALWLGVTIAKFTTNSLSNHHQISAQLNNTITGYITIILFIYWIINWITGSFMSVVVKKQKK